MNIPDEKQNSHARSFKINVIQQICPYFHLPKSQIWGKHWTLAEPRGFSSFFIEWIKFDLQQNSVKCLARLERQNKFQWRLSWWKSQLTAMNRAYYAHSKSAVYFAVSARAWQWLCRPVSTTHTLFMFPSAVTLVSSGCGQKVRCGAYLTDSLERSTYTLARTNHTVKPPRMLHRLCPPSVLPFKRLQVSIIQ